MSVFSRRQHLAVAIDDIGGTQAQQDAVAELVRQFSVSTDKLRAIQTHFIGEMEKGLNSPGQTVAMIPSFVEGRLTGMLRIRLSEGLMAGSLPHCVGEECAP